MAWVGTFRRESMREEVLNSSRDRNAKDVCDVLEMGEKSLLCDPGSDFLPRGSTTRRRK